MHRFTQNVIAAAKSVRETAGFEGWKANPEPVTDRAAGALMNYFLISSGWGPGASALPATVQRWFESGVQKTHDLAKGAWNANRNRNHILEVAILQLQIAKMLEVNDGLEWMPILIHVCNELDTQAKWPELRDVQQFYPAPRVPTQPRTLFPSTATFVYEVNQGVYGQRDATADYLYRGMIEADTNRNIRNQDWLQQQVHQTQMRNKP
jgi:hypothetical protein